MQNPFHAFVDINEIPAPFVAPICLRRCSPLGRFPTLINGACRLRYHLLPFSFVHLSHIWRNPHNFTRSHVPLYARSTQSQDNASSTRSVFPLRNTGDGGCGITCCDILFLCSRILAIQLVCFSSCPTFGAIDAIPDNLTSHA